MPRCKVLWARMGRERPVTGMTLKLELTAPSDGVNVGVTEREERRLGGRWSGPGQKGRGEYETA